MNLSNELTTQVNAHLSEVRKYLGNLPADERQEILQSIESHIYDALETRSNGDPTPALLEAVIAEMDPPESYGELPVSPQKLQPRRRLVLTLLCGLALVALAAAGVKGWRNTNPNIIEHWNPGEKIIEGVGLADFRIGASKEQLIAALGTPDKESTETWLRWKNLRVHSLVDEYRGASELRFDIGFPGTTEKGIKIGSSEAEVLAAYGSPEHVVSKNKAKKLTWSSQGILVGLTTGNGVNQIVVFRPHFPSYKQSLADLNPNLIGRWISIDFVETPDQFDPKTIAWGGDLFLKELTLLPDGKTDRPFWTWTNEYLIHSENYSVSKLLIKTISGEDYLFLEWISGDVTLRGQPPKYYVLKKGNPESTQTPQLTPVSFEQGCNTLKGGDSIVLDEVLSTSPLFTEGDTVTVKGRYTLSSQPSARLALFVTGTRDRGRSTVTKEQRVTVTQGTGEFALTQTIPYHGCSHLTFYDETKGTPLGGIYFGTREQIEEIKPRNSLKEYAWQQTEPYTAPNFYAFFPNDPEGGQALDALWRAADKDSRPDEEILETVRNGLRCTREHKTLILAWIGGRYICGKSPQNPDAVEIMYHAADFSGENADPQGTRHYAVYYGLSVVQPKTPAVLRTLVDLCMRVDDPNDLHAIAWNSRSQSQGLLGYLEPYLQSEDKAVQNKAIVLEQIFTGKLKAFDWAKQRAEAQAAEKYTSQLADIKNILQTGSSLQRKEAQQLIMKERITPIMDDSFISAFAACANDPDAGVRSDAARLIGGRWIWEVPVQSSEAIELMLRLSQDSDREVRYNAVYYGLSVVQNKNEIIIRRLLEMAFDDREPNLYGRIAWGLRGSRDITARLLNEYMAGDNSRFAQCAKEIYEDMTTEDNSSKKKTKIATPIQVATGKTTGTQQTKSKVKVSKNPDISSQDSAPPREVKAPKSAQTDSDKNAEIQRVKARERMCKDLETYSQDELRDIETLYQVANKKWRSEEGKESLRKLISKYSSANRTGCALLYLGQMSTGGEQINYLKQAIENFSDCFYGDGAQVGAYARFILLYRYRNDGEKEKAARLAEEIQTDYPDAIDHRGRKVVELLKTVAD